jgi:hypothetical protein
MKILIPVVVYALSVPVVGARADVTFAGPTTQFGTGFGDVLEVLALHATPQEAGSVLWQGAFDVLTGNATNQSRTQSVADLLAAGADPAHLGMVFNIAEPGAGEDVTLQQFSVVFESPSGSQLFTLDWTGPLTLAAVNNGNGGAGYLFNLNLSSTQLAQFLADPGNRIGMRVDSPILMTAGGPENFYLVPAPSVLATLGIGLGAGRRKRR